LLFCRRRCLFLARCLLNTKVGWLADKPNRKGLVGPDAHAAAIVPVRQSIIVVSVCWLVVAVAVG
jgi:hypothetical protein